MEGLRKSLRLPQPPPDRVGFLPATCAFCPERISPRRHHRRLGGVGSVWCNTPSHHQVSLAGSPPVKDGEGHGERLLLTSCDGTLVVKKIASEEVADMHNILSEYHQVRRHMGPYHSL